MTSPYILLHDAFAPSRGPIVHDVGLFLPCGDLVEAFSGPVHMTETWLRSRRSAWRVEVEDRATAAAIRELDLTAYPLVKLPLKVLLEPGLPPYGLARMAAFEGTW